MKNLICIIILLLPALAFAGRVKLFEAKAPSEVQEPKSEAQKQKPLARPSSDSFVSPPGGLKVLVREGYRAQAPGLSPGDELIAELSHGVIAFLDTKTPVRARLINRKYPGAALLGEASLERNSKRILMEFKRMIFRGEEYSIDASAYSVGGVLGIEGEYKSREAKLLSMEVISAISSGLLEASIERNQNVFGNYQEVPSASNIGKKALGQGAGALARSYQEKLKRSEEYAVCDKETVLLILR